MQELQEKSDSISKSLNLSAPVQQQKILNVSRKIIDTSELRTVRMIKKEEPAQTPQQIQITQQKQPVKKTYVRVPPPARDTISEIKTRSIVAIPEIPVKTEISLPEKRLSRENSDWMLGIIIFSLIIIASVRIIFNTYLKQLFNATINWATATRLFRERTFNLLHAALRLDILFYIVFSLFAYQVLSNTKICSGETNTFIFYLSCLGIVISYFLAKRFLYLLISLINESQAETLEYLFNINIYNRVLGIILFPFTLIIAFVPLYNVKLLLITGLIVIAAFYGLSLVRGSKILLKKHFSISYLILYLCTLEFLPLLMIYKIVSG